jgi:GT2 family glycosyltransferase/glycosyltransferase involved in cell wall biosynthesis
VSLVFIFSKDRPLQLDATLRSFMLHCRDASDLSINVIVKASNENFGLAYCELEQEYLSYSNIKLLAETDFRKQLLQILRSYEYVLFLVDDNIFVRDFSFFDCQHLLEITEDVLGYSLRLGKNTTYCYTLDRQQTLPNFLGIACGSYKYEWASAELDFGYPLEVSSSIYRTRDLAPLLEAVNFFNPNSLESEMASRASYFQGRYPCLICPEQSFTFCNPINKVQTTCVQNRAGDISSEYLLEKYLSGRRINVSLYSGFSPNSCHQEVELHFIAANAQPPLVSIIIPCFNQACYLPDAVGSVIIQAFDDWECIIVNDGSSDNTSDVAKQLIAQFPDRKIRLLEKNNGGLPDARNTGIAASSGQYWLPLDADDRIAPSYLEKALKIFNEHPDVGFVYSHIQHFGEKHDLYVLPEFDANTIVHTDNTACVCSLVRRSVWENVGGYNAEMREGYEDWDFWVGCIENGWKGYRIPEPLFFYRKRTASMLTGSNQKREKLIATIVLNHPSLYSRMRLEEASLILRGEGLSRSKVFIAVSHFWPSIGGLETIAEQLSSNLVLKGYDVYVATSAISGRSSNTYQGVNIISLDTSRLINGALEWLLYIRQEVESGKYSACILIQDPQGSILWAMENIRIPQQTCLILQPIINADGYSRWRGDATFSSRLAAILKKANAAVTMTLSGSDDAYMRSVDVLPVYLPNAVSIPEAATGFREKYNIPASEFLIVHIANLYWVKNHIGLLSALENMPSNWKLVIIGHPSGEEDCAHQFFETLKRFPDVLYIPGLPRTDVSAAMEAADVIVLASHGEGSPVTILEAMAHGKPWLATPNCGAANDNAGGIICELEDFSKHLAVLCDRPDLNKLLGELGKRHWQACFSWPMVIEGWISLIETRKLNSTFEMPPDIAVAMTDIKNVMTSQIANETEYLIRDDISMGKKLVNIGMVTYNRLEFSRQAVDALIKYTSYPYVLTVIDNASTDGTREYLQEQKRRGIIKNLVLLNENIGVAKASNLAWSLEPYANYYLKLDNDIVIQKTGWLAAMVRIVDEIPEMGALAYNFEPESYAVQEMHGHTVRVKKGSLGGACFLVPKRTRDKIGYWCEDYGLYSEEDLDYCTRVFFANMTCAYMADENIGFHLPAGKAAKIDLHSYESNDGIEEIEYRKYRQQKDDSRRRVMQSGLRERNCRDYQDGRRSLYVHAEYYQSWDAAGRTGLVATSSLQRLNHPIQKLKIAVFSLDAKDHACAHYRIQAPFKEFADEVEISWGIEFRENTFHAVPGMADASDLIVVQRFFPRLETASALDYLCSLGKPIIFEIDDLLTQLPPTNPSYGWGMNSAPHIYGVIRKCSAVTVSTEELKKHFYPHNDTVHVLPNLLDSDLWHKTVPPSSGPVVIGYAGTITHNTDLALLEDVLGRIASRYKDRVAFTFMGCATERISKLPGFSFIQFETTFEDYARKLQEISIDIMLAPLEDNPFNRCKSNVKWLEYSACGIAGIYADLPPYNTCITQGETGILVGNTPQQWFNAIDLLIRNPELRRSIAFKARQKVMSEYTLKSRAHRWLEVYRGILGKHSVKPDVVPLTNRTVKVSIVIPVFNQLPFTRQCLDALFATLPAAIPFEIIVVDNGSTDGTPEYLRNLADRVTTVSNRENLGFAKACNQGARTALGETLLFLNNDTIPKPGGIEALISAIDNDEADICGARLLYPDGRCQHAGVAFDERGLGYHIFGGFPGDSAPVMERRRMQAVTGACLTMRKNLFHELGGFDEGFRNGFEDVDLCLRAGEKGRRILYVPESALVHYAEQSCGRKDNDFTNMQRYFARWQGKVRQDDADLYTRFGLTSRRETDGRIIVTPAIKSPVMVSIIIPLFNKAELTRACLRALERDTARDSYELLLVDNCSSDDTVGLLREWEQKATIIRNSENRGFAAACNQGARTAKGEYLLFLNNDTEVTTGWLDTLIATLKNDPTVAAVGSKLLFPDGTIQHAGVMIVDDRVSKDPLVGKHYYFRFPSNHPPANLVMRMQAVTAACILIRHTAFKAVGGFDEGYWNGYEDLDLCFKLGSHAWKVVYQPASVVIHHESQSGPERFRRAPDNIRRLHERWLGKIKPDMVIMPDTSVLNGPGILEGLTGIYKRPESFRNPVPAHVATPIKDSVNYPLIPLVSHSASSVIQKLSSSQRLKGILRRYTIED